MTEFPLTETGGHGKAALSWDQILKVTGYIHEGLGAPSTSPGSVPREDMALLLSISKLGLPPFSRSTVGVMQAENMAPAPK